ncbi:separin protein, partial [Coemansia asiatica]
MAMDICKAMSDSVSSSIYISSVLAECYVWRSIIKIENSGSSSSSADIAACTRLSVLVYKQISGKEQEQDQEQGLSAPDIDMGVLRNMIDSLTLLLGLLMSRRMHSYCRDIELTIFNIASLCEAADRAWSPVTMKSLVGLGMVCVLQGQMKDAAEYFSHASSRYESGVLPVHVEVASKIAYASFQLASGDTAAGVSIMEEAGKVARNALDLGVSMSLSARKKRQPVSPETLILLSKASQAYSVMALKQGALADSIDFSVHSYRILNALLKSLSLVHRRNMQDRVTSSANSSENGGDKMNVVGSDDPFADDETSGSVSLADSKTLDNEVAAAAQPEKTNDAVNDEDKSDAQFVAFSGNWELQRLLIENLAHLAEVYSIRGSVKEAEYFLKKGIEISIQLQAPYQEDFMRLVEADILSRKSLWDECAHALHNMRGCSHDRSEDDVSSAAMGEMEIVCALVNEGDSWRRSRQVSRARSAYSKALAMLESMSSAGAAKDILDLSASTIDLTQVTPRLRRILAQAAAYGNQSSVVVYDLAFAERMDDSDGKDMSLALSIMQEDIATRLQLLSLVYDSSETSIAGSSVPKTVQTSGSTVVSGRSMDKQPEHFLMRANLAFIELQRMLSEEPAWKLVLQSALLFPAFRKARSQKPRKGTTKALIRDKLAELDGLLRAAAESAITVGSAHCVHESTHLLALVLGMSATFGFAPISGAGGRSIDTIVARVVGDSLNITAVRESVDAMRRRGEAVPAELTIWPQDITQRYKSKVDKVSSGNSGSFSRDIVIDRDAMNASPVPSLRFGGTRSRSRDVVPAWNPGAISLPSPGGLSPADQDSFSAAAAAATKTAEESAAEPSEDCYFAIAADGARVVAEWAIDSDTLPIDPLSSTLPQSWVVCGISVDESRNSLFITRYERGCSPITLCLPMREIELSLEFVDQMNNASQSSTKDEKNQSVFASAYQKMSVIISESDRTMKTGSSCSTDEEKRSWWDYRATLDRQLGLFLQSIEDVWLGGFRHVLRPGKIIPGIIGFCDESKKDDAKCSAMVASLRKCIQTCLGACLPKTFASKAKAIEQSEQLCILVLAVAQRAIATTDKDDTSSGCYEDRRSDWLDICSMLWDLYCYQGAAPSSDDASLDSFAENLLEAMHQFIRENDWVLCNASNNTTTTTSDSSTQRPHLILALDKHAQQIPWESLPILREHPISRVPSIAFLQHRISMMNSRRSAQTSSQMPSRPESFISENAGDLLSILNSAPAGQGSPVAAQDAALDLAGLTVSGQQVFYVLNPEGDLHRTQTNFADYLEAQLGWRGVVGRRPMNHECEHGLSTSDVFMYFGHGGAENYISRSQIRSLRRCAVALLFGCSSGRLKMAGEYDAMGTATDYMVGGCPALVGNLWDVGDKDIDRFAACMLNGWGLDKYSPGKIAVK